MTAAAVNDLSGWLARLEALHPAGSDGIELGLDRVDAVRNRLGIDCTAPVVLVGGTNGKGSTCVFIEAILRSAGYRVGRYSSPHLLAYNERIRIDGMPVDDDRLCAAFSVVEAARGDVPLTYFEFGTLAAWVVFAEAGLDAVVMEVGLGGRLDATNIFTPACSVVTTVDLDHQAFLGPDREAIGFEKAGIFRAGVPALCGDGTPPHSLLQHAGKIGSPLACMGRDFGWQMADRQWTYWNGGRRRGGLAMPALRGQAQLNNAACAIAAVESLADHLPVSMRDIRAGLADAVLPGRFQVLPGRPEIVLDVAHNAQAARTLAANLDEMGFASRTLAVFGMMADKDIDAVIEALGTRVDLWLPCTLPGRRPATTVVLNERLASHAQSVAGVFESPAIALNWAREQAGEADRIIAFGSFLVVAGALEALRRPA